MRYGLPYMGSKNKIAEWVVSNLAKAENFYDLFCGGCAITHCAMLQCKYENYFINDIKSEMTQAFTDCINGKYANDYRWISKEDFDNLKGHGDMLVDLCFSFGNNWRKGYAYSKDIEPFKRAFHYAIVLGDFSIMKEEFGIDLTIIKDIKDVHERYIAAKKIIGNGFQMQHLESLERLQTLERLQSLQKLQTLRWVVNLNIYLSSVSYDQVEIKNNSVIYCDIPYKSTSKYNEFEFNYNNFYEWCLRQTEPVYISEYEMPESDFVCIAETKKICNLSATNNSLETVERIFMPKKQYDKYRPKTLFDL